MKTMSEKNDNIIKDIREGLVQFIGALLDNTSYEGAAARQIVCAALTEEALKLATQHERIEYYSAKPILRATLLILDQRKKEYGTLLAGSPSPETDQYVMKALQDIRTAENLINGILKLEDK